GRNDDGDGRLHTAGRHRAHAHGAPTWRSVSWNAIRSTSRSRRRQLGGGNPAPKGMKNGPPWASTSKPAAVSRRRWPTRLGVHHRGLPSPSRAAAGRRGWVSVVHSETTS